MSANELPDEDKTTNKQNSSPSGGANFTAARDVDVEVGRDFVSGDSFVGDKAGGDIIRGDNFSGAQVTYYQYYGVPESQVEDAEPAPGDPPYKGMLFYTEEDAHLFFGRTQEVGEMVTHLQDYTFLAVVGASGCGKSSLIRAGILPALKRGDILTGNNAPPEGSNRWPVHIITPTGRPLESLAASLTRNSESVTAAFTFAQDLASDTRSLDLMARRLTSDSGAERLLLVIDQFEELFTQCENDAERQTFIDNLMHAIDPINGSVTLVIGLRVAFMRNCERFESLTRALQFGRKDLSMIKSENLREAIVSSAEQDDWEFEDGLIDLLLRDAGFEPAVLPWLSHALLETWKRRRGRILTFSGYAEAGGLRGAIVHKATAIYQQFDEQEQHIARNVFMRLTKLGEGTQDSRRRAPLNEIIPPDPNSDPMLLSVLQMLAKSRLIVVSDDGMHAAHEAIVRDWTLLRGWVEDNRAGLRIHRVLADDAANWVHLGHDRGALYRGVKLGQALEWAEQHPQDLNAIERSFLETARDVVEQERKAQEEAQRQQLETAQKLAESERQRAEEQEAVAVQQQHTAERMRRSAQRLAVLFGVAGILAIVALIAFYFAGQNRELADQKQRTTRARELSAIAQRLIPDYPQRSLLLAVEAYNTLLEDDPRVPEVEEALRLSLAGAGGRSLPFESSLTTIENPITAVAISSDQKWLVAGAENGEVYLWDRTNLELPPIVLSHDYEAKVLDVVIGPGSSWMYTSIEGNAVYQWDLYNLEFPPLPLLSSNENEYQLSLAVNDKWLIGGGENGNLSVWTLDDLSAAPEVFTAHGGAIYDVNFNTDGNLLITASGDSTATIYRADSLETLTAGPQAVIDGHNEPLFGAAISSDNQYVITGGGTPPWIAIDSRDAVALVWKMDDLTTPVAELSDHTAHITAVSISPDNQWITTASWDHTAHIYSLQDPLADPYILRGHEDYVSTIVFAPDGNTLITAGGDRSVRVWGLNNREAGLIASPVILRGHQSILTEVEISPDNQWIATAGRDGVAILWRLNAVDPSLNRRFLAAHDGPIHALAFSPNSHWLATGGEDGKVFLWNLTSPNLEKSGRELHGHIAEISTLTFNEDSTVLISGGHDGQILAWHMDDLSGGQVIGQWEDGYVHQVGFNRVEGPRAGAPHWLIASVGSPPDRLDFEAENHILLWNAEDLNSEPIVLTGHHDAVNTYAISQDGRWMASADGSGLILVWDLDNPRARPISLDQYPDGIRQVALSPNGRWLVAAGWSPDLYIWDRQDYDDGPIIETDHNGWINDIAISNDGQWLVSSSPDRTARLWSLDNAFENEGTLNSVLLSYHEDNVGNVAISPDSMWVVTISDDQTALLWSLDVDQLLDLACRTAGRNLRNDRDEWQRYFAGEAYHETCPITAAE